MGSKKIALFLPDLSGGGAERMMVNLACGFANRGAKVDMVLLRKEGSYLSLIPSSVRIVDLQVERTVRGILPLAGYLRREHPAALLSTFVNVNIAALLARRLANIPVRIVIRQPRRETANHSTPVRPLMYFGYRLQSSIYGWADEIVAVSRGVANDMVQNIGVPSDRMHVINNPVVTPKLFQQASEPIDHPWFAPGNQQVILAAGRLVHEKDFPTLIYAFAKVRRRRPTKLVILGEGKSRPMLERLRDSLGLHEAIDLPGFVKNPYAFMARAAVFVLSSRLEGSPNVLVEAMACGTPVVSTDCPSGPSETLEDGRFGRLVPVSEASALANAIVETLDAPLPGVILQRRARDFAVERSVDQYLRVLLGDSMT